MSVKRRGLGLFKAAVAVFALVIGPCSNVQFPPSNTELFWGVAIATGAEISAPAVVDGQQQFVEAADAATD
ncbi:MAG: hypothetical protein GY778_28340 [bacterium]|nr:hypothetical protein [bacterium]